MAVFLKECGCPSDRDGITPIVYRNVSPTKTAAVTVGSIQAAQDKSFGLTGVFQHLSDSPVLVNRDDATDFVINVTADLFGADHVMKDIPSVTGSEDLALMLEGYPNECYFYLGNADQSGNCMVHNPEYIFDDDIIILGTTMWCGITETYLKS